MGNIEDVPVQDLIDKLIDGGLVDAIVGGGIGAIALGVLGWLARNLGNAAVQAFLRWLRAQLGLPAH